MIIGTLSKCCSRLDKRIDIFDARSHPGLDQEREGDRDETLPQLCSTLGV
jgi:hypothetical protein